jgi:hypothetical protein
MTSNRLVIALAALTLLSARPAGATFHFMQVEQVIGGVNGATRVQAIQLRMRSAGQNLMSNAQLVVSDATGSNPVILIAFPTNVTNGAAGARVLAATADFVAATTPNLTPDFILTNPIPDSYLAAGTLTYEDDFGTILWRLSWGGINYTGPEDGDITNDLDGVFGPPLPGPLPSTTTDAVQFKFATAAKSTNNASDYALTGGDAMFVNNAGQSGTINSLVSVDQRLPQGSLALLAPAPNPVRTTVAYGVVLPSESRVQVRVVDVGGRVVGTLVDGALTAGRHAFSWNGAGREGAALPNGVYFLEMNAQGVTRTQRFVLLH